MVKRTGKTMREKKRIAGITYYRWTFRKDLYLKEREIPESKFLWVDELNGKSFIVSFGLGSTTVEHNKIRYLLLSSWCDVEEVKTNEPNR